MNSPNAFEDAGKLGCSFASGDFTHHYIQKERNIKRSKNKTVEIHLNTITDQK